VLGSMAIPLARPLFMALSLLRGRMTFWRLLLCTRSISTSVVDA